MTVWTLCAGLLWGGFAALLGSMIAGELARIAWHKLRKEHPARRWNRGRQADAIAASRTQGHDTTEADKVKHNHINRRKAATIAAPSRPATPSTGASWSEGARDRGTRQPRATVPKSDISGFWGTGRATKRFLRFLRCSAREENFEGDTK